MQYLIDLFYFNRKTLSKPVFNNIVLQRRPTLQLFNKNYDSLVYMTVIYFINTIENRDMQYITYQKAIYEC